MDIINKNNKRIFNQLDEGIYYVDKNRKIRFWSKAAEEITGFKAVEVKNKHCYDNILNHIDENGKELCFQGCPLEQSIKEDIENEGIVFLHHKDGHRVPIRVRTAPVTDDNDEVVGGVEIFSKEYDTYSILEDKEELIKLAMFDSITDLPNRRYLEEEIEFKMNEANYNYSKKKYGLFFLDVDNFKSINDNHGHQAGDMVLKNVAKTLKGNLKKLDVIGRWGGNEFVGVVVLKKSEELNVVIEKLRVLIENSNIRVDDLIINITVSIGATLIKPEEELAGLIDRADKLMYQSKEQGKNKINID